MNRTTTPPMPDPFPSQKYGTSHEEVHVTEQDAMVHMDELHRHPPPHCRAASDYHPMHHISKCNAESGSGLRRTKSVVLLSTMSTEVSICSSASATSLSSVEQSASLAEETGGEPKTTKSSLGAEVRRITGGNPGIPDFNSREMRAVIEPHVARVRLKREKSSWRMGSRAQYGDGGIISRSAVVPYSCLRSERPFLFDEHTFPLHRILADTLKVEDLSLLHRTAPQDKRQLWDPLLHAESRFRFHACYDHFVTYFCIPLLHSMGLAHNLFNSRASSTSGSPERITYRYQSFPCLRIVRPGESSTGIHCDVNRGHSVGSLNFHVPLTPAFGTNALYTESHPGREDWHPLSTKSFGMGYLFDGARCLHFSLENTTDRTRVSLEFRVAIYRKEEDHRRPPQRGDGDSFRGAGGDRDRGNDDDPLDKLCSLEMLEDRYSTAEPGYYEEATVDLGVSSNAFLPGPVVRRKNGGNLSVPDGRVGFPFDVVSTVSVSR